MSQRRGWLWMTSGILLALIAGIFTFRAINDTASNVPTSVLQEAPTVPVLVAAIDIPPRQLIDESMVTVKNAPANLVPDGFLDTLDDVVGKMAITPITKDEILLRDRLVDPTNKDAPVLYRLNENEILLAVPADALLSNLGMVSVGDHVDLASTVVLDYVDKDTGTTKTTTSAFLSLQNLEVQGVMSREPLPEGSSKVLKPDAVLLAVPQQDALVIKYLIDTGASMDFFLRPPGIDTLSTAVPVDADYLVNRFQLLENLPKEVIDEIIRRQQSASTAPSPTATPQGASGSATQPPAVP